MNHLIKDIIKLDLTKFQKNRSISNRRASASPLVGKKTPV